MQTPTQVKITDFGLAKLLDYNEDEYHAAGGKVGLTPAILNSVYSCHTNFLAALSPV